VRQIPAEPAQLVNAPSADVIFVDARTDLVGAKSLCKILNTTGLDAPLVLIVTEGGLTAVSTDWGVDDVILSPRPRRGRRAHPARGRTAERRADDEPHPDLGHHDRRVVLLGQGARQAARSHLQGVPAAALLRDAPSRVFTREQLLSEVWGYDYFGGTRTVDVHVRRLRAKLGDLEQLIGTVRNVGYRFNVYEDDQAPASAR
jgi:DNA-binding response OmpR family regulator